MTFFVYVGRTTWVLAMLGGLAAYAYDGYLFAKFGLGLLHERPDVDCGMIFLAFVGSVLLSLDVVLRKIIEWTST